MNLYKIYSYSSCGTYFNSYLKSVTVVAANEEDAFKTVRAWMKKDGRTFVNPEYGKRVVKYGKDKGKESTVRLWGIQLLSKNLTVNSVVDTEESADY